MMCWVYKFLKQSNVLFKIHFLFVRSMSSDDVFLSCWWSSGFRERKKMLMLIGKQDRGFKQALSRWSGHRGHSHFIHINMLTHTHTYVQRWTQGLCQSTCTPSRAASKCAMHFLHVSACFPRPDCVYQKCRSEDATDHAG